MKTFEKTIAKLFALNCALLLWLTLFVSIKWGLFLVPLWLCFMHYIIKACRWKRDKSYQPMWDNFADQVQDDRLEPTWPHYPLTRFYPYNLPFRIEYNSAMEKRLAMGNKW